ncbi:MULTISPECIES: chromosomal replication initiator protein DnaA [Micrococcaceae]|jgi:chromosomal replication initiator protein|uniref:Chromosomal replication initiator protein DnaA n=1 Tax=Pseudarthrobacter siccitolerans TaxID=861266 RepID=A0ABU0PLV3_9MICC|nr:MULTISPECIES: chromosomal replication initiator protein DnaA [Micrococcaceae]MDQ0674950.1 chromosomal replication initiator protein [Pseudarthrobacter siccitolerans]MDQ0693352.1 chromosomal replication initiator protein [Arthrobacter sp. W4I7]MDQ0925719.1 chromosomal replication initiator protein [Pseudarthrobacter sp. W1I19]SEQ50292.1 chromosomal replication initiator protein DnaA [Arthrobacter sp. OV608]VXB01989.1 chromosomal replication initiator informational ATPase [Arthrobacter sp. 9A
MTVDEANHANTVGSSWRRVVSLLEQDHRVSPRQRGFVILAQAQGLIGSTLLVAVPNELTREVLQTQVKDALDDALHSVFSEDIRCAIDVDTDLVPIHEEPEPVVEPSFSPDQLIEQKPQPMLPSTSHEFGRLNPKYVFDTFVIGSSNRFAHAAAVAVAEAPAKAYNPLFIYGDSGLGKTHLLHAIGHYARRLYSGIRVRYVNSEEFTNDFINSIRDDEGASFKTTYRNVDVLLIDDIQFLAGKDRTLEEFFHTFNSLHNNNKQVVITSDQPPKLLAGFEDRMKSRFEWGLLTDIQPPELETRIAILRKKALSEGLSAPDDALEYIASKISSNIRELEGALIRVTAFASLNRQPVDVALAEMVLKDLITDDGAQEITSSQILQQTAEYFKLSMEELCSKSRTRTLVTARQIAMYLCRELTDMSLPKIGQELGGRDHTTVIHADRKIRELMAERRVIYNQVTELTNRIKQQQRDS